MYINILLREFCGISLFAILFYVAVRDRNYLSRSAPLLLAVSRVLGDFSPRKSRPSSLWLLDVLLSALFLKECCFLSPLLLLVKKSPKLCVLTINNRVYRRDFSIFLLRLANQQPAALTFAALSAKNLKSHHTNIHATE